MYSVHKTTKAQLKNAYLQSTVLYTVDTENNFNSNVPTISHHLGKSNGNAVAYLLFTYIPIM
jgi:hypothetical protein